MGIAAVLSYIQSVTDGQVLAGSQTLASFVMPMPILRNGLPEPLRLYIWPTRVHITQPTMSGQFGYRWARHQPLSLSLRQTVGQAASVAQFPSLVDSLLDLLLTQNSSIPIDTSGNVVSEAQMASSITFIALETDVQFRYPRMTLGQRPVTLLCEINALVQEQFTP